MITFIIPSIGRNTLNNAIKSIENQTSSNWKIIVVFDGIKSTITTNHPKITILEISKEGKGVNSAGNVRNHGMKHVDTEWIAFLDDDDIIASDYVETFEKEYEVHPFIDVFIFRMYRNKEQDILPLLHTDNFYINQVGISFIIKSDIFTNGLQFSPSSTEDYNFLHLLRENNYCIMISPYTKYFVDGNVDVDTYDYLYNTLGERVIINNTDLSRYEGFSTAITKNTDFHLLFHILFLCFLFLLFIICSRIKKYNVYSSLFFCTIILYIIYFSITKLNWQIFH